MGQLIEGYKAYRVRLPGWDVETTVIRTESGATFFAVKPLCEAVGVSMQGQLKQLREDERFSPALASFRVPTAGGEQEAVCIRRRECAWWLANISPARVKPEVAGRLADFQATLMAVADRLAWGDMSDLADAARPALARPLRGELHFGCPRCGAALCFVADADGVHLTING